MGFKLREVLEQLSPKKIGIFFSKVDDLHMVQLTQKMQNILKSEKNA